jgi:DNA repair protein RadD
VKLWKHQERTIAQLREAINQGQRRIVVVGPTGSGKGTLATEILRLTAQQGKRGLFVAHRREIVLDVAARVRATGVRVGVILPGHNSSPYADVQIASTDTLKNRSEIPHADVVIPDECHHYATNKWSALIDRYQDAVVVGLTATPERADGKPLSQFQHMIVAAQYSELIQAGLIVPAKVYQPSENRGSDLALDPVEAYSRYAPGTKGFCFVATLELARDVTARFNAAGIPSLAITGKTPKGIRDRALEDLKRGNLLMLNNYNTLTEGTDVPDATTCIIARPVRHTGTYLQCAGRVLRAHSSKRVAIVLDLVGASLVHGLPHQDREYSLEGKKGYNLANLAPLTVCPSCGLTQLAGRSTCEGCGFVFLRHERKPPVIYSQELKAVFDFENTPTEAKLVEYFRLLDISLQRAYSIDWVCSSYTATFGEKVPQRWLTELPGERKRREFEQWKQYGESRGFKKGYAFARYLACFGCTP